MSKTWETTVVVSVALNLVCFIAIAVMAGALVDAQWKNISLFQQLSVDQQTLRRELDAATARFEAEPR
jgi:hypothetical protein